MYGVVGIMNSYLMLDLDEVSSVAGPQIACLPGPILKLVCVFNVHLKAGSVVYDYRAFGRARLLNVQDEMPD
jgi:hypothetical protein